MTQQHNHTTTQPHNHTITQWHNYSMMIKAIITPCGSMEREKW